MNFKQVNQIIERQNASVSCVLIEANTGLTLFEHETGVRLRSASIIKLYILASCAEMFDSGSLSPDKILEISEEDQVPFSLISDLNTGNWRVDDIATLMIILSDNTATNVLIDLIGLDKINDFIRQNGFANTVLQRKMMDFESASKGLDNYTSLADTRRLLEQIFKAAGAGNASALWMMDVLSKQKDKTMLARFLPESIELAHKTGLNHGIQHDVGFFNHGDKTYIMGVFVDGEPDEIKGFECIGQIGKHMYMEVQSGV